MEEKKDYTRKERLEGLKAMVAFLEANEDFDLPECIEHGLVRTLTRQNRKELQDRESRVRWFLKHVEIMDPDKIDSGTDFYAVKYFGGGAKIVVELGAYEAAEVTTEKQMVHRPTFVETKTWNVPDELVKAGFHLDQDALRKREAEYNGFLTGKQS